MMETHYAHLGSVSDSCARVHTSGGPHHTCAKGGQTVKSPSSP